MDQDDYRDVHALVKQLPPNWWLSSGLVGHLRGWFLKHIIGLFVGGWRDNKPFQVMYTGSLLTYRGRVLWATAGHVIDDLSQALKREDIKIDVMRWVDYQAEGAKDFVVHRRDFSYVSFKEQYGVDFGFIILDGLDLKNIIRNNNARPISLEANDLQALNPEGYYLLGYPRELTGDEIYAKDREREYHKFAARLVCLPITRTPHNPNMPSNDFWNDPDAFYGRIQPLKEGPSDGVLDIDGMSGGPLLSIQRTEAGEIPYRLIGIQRSWDEDERIIRAEPIQKAVALLDAVFDDIEDSAS